jgi:hypothetical protein
MLKRNDKGPEVKKLQEVLLELGEALPRWGADGDLGDETFEALSSLLCKHGRTVDPDPNIVSDAELAFVYALRDLLRVDHGVKPPAKLVDRRQCAKLDLDRGSRPITEVKGACLHQTACYLSASKDPARCDAIGAHFVVYPDGTVYWLHDVTRKIVHGNEWNSQTYGIEIDGLFAGVEGDPKTVWDNPKTPYVEKAGSLTPEQVEAVKQLLRWQDAELRRQGGHQRLIVAHRQASGMRRNDPGSKVWKEIALPMLQELGLSDGGPGFALVNQDGGYPIPESWDPSRKGIPY